mmetsp:Transcript_853/g.2088  ORF Transcript_853/g.2088 Transcript_853/m.2088 type:complete len:239 (-) Transcript_853:334-1050(-)
MQPSEDTWDHGGPRVCARSQSDVSSNAVRYSLFTAPVMTRRPMSSSLASMMPVIASALNLSWRCLRARLPSACAASGFFTAHSMCVMSWPLSGSAQRPPPPLRDIFATSSRKEQEGSMKSTLPPNLVPIVGSSIAIASISGSPQPSPWLGSTNACAALYSLGMSRDAMRLSSVRTRFRMQRGSEASVTHASSKLAITTSCGYCRIPSWLLPKSSARSLMSMRTDSRKSAASAWGLAPM